MAGEPILIVDDTPVNLKLTRILLVNEGYTVITAGSAEEAFDLLRSYHPQLILADIQLPGMDGLEMTRQIKQNALTRDIVVVALTAFAMKGDEQRALEAGCSAYITKPIDTRTLGSQIRQLLTLRGKTDPPAEAAPAVGGLPADELQALRRRFLQEGQQRARQLLLDLDQSFDPSAAARAVHQFVGAGGLLGYPALSRLSREVESQLLERPVDAAEVRESLTNLLLAFSTAPEALETPVAEGILQALGGKSIAIAGLPAPETQRLCVALERARARAAFFELSSRPDAAALAKCDLAVIYIHPADADSAWLNPASPACLPTVFVGSREDLLALAPEVQALAAEFLMDGWQPEEALVRLTLAITSAVMRNALPEPAAESGPLRVLVADGDANSRALVCTTLEHHGLTCDIENNGSDALDAARRLRPQAAVLAVDLPGMDGFELLAAMRAENLPVHVMLLTTHQAESDVIRGFALGAGDYMVKPFSPMELVARVHRLHARLLAP